MMIKYNMFKKVKKKSLPFNSVIVFFIVSFVSQNIFSEEYVCSFQLKNSIGMEFVERNGNHFIISDGDEPDLTDPNVLNKLTATAKKYQSIYRKKNTGLMSR